MERADTDRVSLSECIRLLVLLFASAPRAPTEAEIVKILRALSQADGFRQGGVERLGEAIDCIFRKKMPREADNTSVEGKIGDFLDHEIRLLKADHVAKAVNYVFCYSSDQALTLGEAVSLEVYRLMSLPQEPAVSVDKPAEEKATNDAGGPPPSAPPAKKKKPQREEKKMNGTNNRGGGCGPDAALLAQAQGIVADYGILLPESGSLLAKMGEATGLQRLLGAHALAQGFLEEQITILEEQNRNLAGLVEQARASAEEKQRMLEEATAQSDIVDARILRIQKSLRALQDEADRSDQRLNARRTEHDLKVGQDNAEIARIEALMNESTQRAAEAESRLREVIGEEGRRVQEILSQLHGTGFRS